MAEVCIFTGLQPLSLLLSSLNKGYSLVNSQVFRRQPLLASGALPERLADLGEKVRGKVEAFQMTAINAMSWIDDALPRNLNMMT